MGMLFGRPLLYAALSIVALVLLAHVLFSFPVLLVVGVVVAALWMRNGGLGSRSLRGGRWGRRYLDTRSRW